MTEDRLSDYLDHLLEALDLATAYVDGMDRQAFMADRRTQQAVMLNIIILGEAAAKIVQSYPDFADAHPDIPWRQMRGMRNRVAHGYFDIDLDIVWNTVQSAFPGLRAQVGAAKRNA